ncbi:MAG: hypothetical protein M0C28_29555 [Candidatus Moduliflexus flocculans]|nr:hypothetical protein [Candidatus Moduliflexus flocculans]
MFVMTELLRDDQESPAEDQDQEDDRDQPQGDPAARPAPAVYAGAREKEGGFRVEGGLAGTAISGSRTCSPNTRAPRNPNWKLHPNDTALFQYSGGTTGISKGAVAIAPQRRGGHTS